MGESAIADCGANAFLFGIFFPASASSPNPSSFWIELHSPRVLFFPARLKIENPEGQRFCFCVVLGCLWKPEPGTVLERESGGGRVSI